MIEKPYPNHIGLRLFQTIQHVSPRIILNAFMLNFRMTAPVTPVYIYIPQFHGCTVIRKCRLGQKQHKQNQPDNHVLASHYHNPFLSKTAPSAHYMDGAAVVYLLRITR